MTSKAEYQLETKLHKAENYLSVATALPVIGIAGGAAKVSLGSVQAASAAAVTLFAGLNCMCGAQDAKKLTKRSLKHIAHGIGNITAGVIESVPFVGLASAALRYRSWNSAHPAGPGVGLYMAYGDLYKPEAQWFDDINWFETRPLPLIRI